jgi:hypothetical protein
MTYFKAIRPDGTSFHDPSFTWATKPGGITRHLGGNIAETDSSTLTSADRDEAYRSGVRDCADRIDTYRDRLDDATRAIVGDHLTTAADELRRALLDGPR